MAGNTQAGYWTDISSFQPGRTHIDVVAVLGTSGAAPTTLTKGAGVASFTGPTGTGVYTLTLSQVYAAGLLAFPRMGTLQASYSTSGACDIILTSNAIATTGVLTFTTVTAAGAAVTPATGDTLYISLCVGAYVSL
jgi:hypothetical protein